MTENIISHDGNLGGSYVGISYTPSTVESLMDFQSFLELKNPVSPEDFHTTIVYSNIPINWVPLSNVGIKVKPKSWQVWNIGKTFALILELESEWLQDRFNLSMQRGAVYDFETYRPHITLSYDVPETFDYSSLQLPTFEIILDSEYCNKLDRNWGE